MPSLFINGVSKSFGRQRVVDNFSLTVESGQFVALLGPSGCGKSTILSLIAGFETPDTGTILLEDRLLNGLPPQKRNVALLLQDLSVFTRMTVRQNLAFGLEARGYWRLEIARRLETAAARFGIVDLLDRSAADLNFSEKQRIALARSLITEPSVLLLDEPMSSLDATDRTRMRSELKLIHSELRPTVLLVTHDQSEALSLADLVVVMREGKIEQIGEPEVVFNQPRSAFVAEFLGEPPANLFKAELVDGAGRAELNAAGVRFRTDRTSLAASELTVSIRAHDIKLSREPGPVQVRVGDVEFLGAEDLVRFSLGALALAALVPAGRFRTGERAFISVDPIPGLVLASGQATQITGLEIVP
jgi:ABC-type sugar transport system ATPase subunit